MKKHNPEEWKNIRSGWTDLPTLRERVESAEMYITALEAAIEEMRMFAIHGCATKRKDARGRHSQESPMIDLSQVPDAELGREWMRRLHLRRWESGKPRKGRNKVLRPCPWCFAQFGALELRQHKPGCQLKPRRVD